MSTLSGPAAKGEKGKSKFQSLDINNLYKHSRGESSETHQQKSTIPRKHGMQPLGKVPSTRRPPVNLPSLKSEHSGNDPAVSLVPSGGSGWGSKPGEIGQTPAQQPSSQASNLTTQANQTTPSVPAAAPTPTAPPAISQTSTSSTQNALVGRGKSVTSTLGSSGGDKTWSSVTCGAEAAPSFLAHQSPQFQQEFPSLSGEGVGPGPPPPKTDTQYGPGPSLRPQTEGSWIQGGGTRGVQGTGGQLPPPGNQQTTNLSQDGVRNNLGQFGVPGAQGGQQSAQGSSNYKSVFPSFMTSNRGGYPSMLSSNFQTNTARPRYQYQPDGGNRGRPAPPLTDPEDLIPRPIIREEDLNRMDELARDASWAAQEDIDYNQTLAFSDDENAEDKSGLEKKEKGKIIQNDLREEKKDGETEKESKEKQLDKVISSNDRNQTWQARNAPTPLVPPTDYRNPSNRVSLQGSRVDDDEIWRERRRQHTENVAAITEKAKQRKEEEEKRFEESRAKSNQHLDSDKKKKEEGGLNEMQITPNNASEWEKDEKNQVPSPSSNKETSDNFRQMTQLENRPNFGRERDRGGEGGYQRLSNLPPRLQRLVDRPSNNQSYRQPTSSVLAPNYDSRWNSGVSNNQSSSSFQGKHSAADRGSKRNRNENEISDKEKEKEREEEIKERDRREKHTPELSSERDRFRRGERGHDNRKGGYYDSSSDYNRSYQKERDREYERERNKDIDYKDKEKDLDRDELEWEGRRGAEWEGNRHYEDRNRREVKKNESFKLPADAFEEREVNDWRGERERPQRPDSRDSRASRESRNSRESNREDSRLIAGSTENDYAWVDNDYEKDVKEEKSFRKEVYKDDRRENQHRQREGHVHVPGPITREKMEAYEYKHNLAQGDKKESSVLGGPSTLTEDETWGKGSQTGQTGNVCWADNSEDNANSSSDQPSKAVEVTSILQETNKEETLEKDIDKEDTAIDKKKENIKKEREKNSRNTTGNAGNRSIRGGRQGGGYSTGGSYGAYRPYGGRPDSKNRRGLPRMASQKHWNHSESEVSGDEVSASTESGKEDKKDKKQTPRSPKSGVRKADKDNRNKESQHSSGDGGENPMTPKQERKNQGGNSSTVVGGERKEREGFAPIGEPSRRGRGGGLRSRGAISNVAGHYGPPGSKSPFPHQQAPSSQQDEEDKNQDDGTLDDKMKIKQQSLSVGISIGLNRQHKVESHQLRKIDGNENNRLNKNKQKSSEQGDEAWETTSEASDTEGKSRKGFLKNKSDRKPSNRSSIGDKRGNYISQMNGRAGRSEDSKSCDDLIGEKKRDNESTTTFTNNGFQEVRNKKLGKDGGIGGNITIGGGRSMKEDSKRGGRGGGKGGGGSGGKEKGGISGMGNSGGVNSVGSGRGGPGGQSKPFSRDREWYSNKPPRLQRMENLRKQQLHHEVSDMNKLNQSVSLFLNRDVGCPPPAPPPSVNAWDKPITATLRTTPPPQSSPLQLGSSISSSQDKTGIELNDHGQSGTSSQTSSPNAEKTLTKMTAEKSLLDGATPPVQTIIFENTNYKAPSSEMTIKTRYNMSQKGQRIEKGRGKIDEDLDDTHMGLGGFKTGELKPSDKMQDSIQMSIAFNKNEDNVDMKLDFPFDSDLSQLTDEKSNIPRSIHLGQTSAADLDQKIASVKKVWDNPAGSMMEHQHHVDETHGVVSTASSFTPPFGSGVDTALDPTATHQGDEHTFSAVDVYSTGAQIQGSNSYATSGPNMMKTDPSSASGGVCKVNRTIIYEEAHWSTEEMLLNKKVKQQPQPAAVVLGPGMPPHSPPPYSQTSHINYQAQFGSTMPGIPSPPTALFGSAQQVPSQGDLYHSYPIGNTQVLGGQGRSTYSQFQYNMSQGLNQTASYTQFHLQTAPPPSAPPLDAFNLYRTQAAPSSFGGSPQLSNSQNPVLMSSSSNSLMSASVKSSTQPIGTIGSKAPYQSTAPPPSAQVYHLQYDPPPQIYPQNFMAGSQLVQQRAAIQASPSYYSNSDCVFTGAQTGLFQGSSMLGTSGQAPLHSTTYGIQSFGTQSPAPAPTGTPNPVGVQSYASQMGPVRGGGGGVYLKPTTPNPQHSVDSKSPSSNPEAAIQSVFGQQIPSPKSRGSGGGKQGQGGVGTAPQQPSPTQSHHKFPSYQPHTVSQQNLSAMSQSQQGGGGRGGVIGGGGGVRGGGVNSAPRYSVPPPGPIQRPSYPPPQQQGLMRHPTTSRPIQPSRPPTPQVNSKIANQYFQQQGNQVKLEGTNLEGKCESGSDMKLGVDSGSSGGSKQTSEKVKEEVSGGGQEQ